MDDLCQSKGDKSAQIEIIFSRISNLMWVIAESFLRAVTEKGVDYAPYFLNAKSIEFYKGH